MQDQLPNTSELMEELKEAFRIQYDYFKHLTTLSISSAGAIIALILRVFPTSKCIYLSIMSLVCLFFCLVTSLWVMPAPGNAIQYIVAIKAAKLEKDVQKQASSVTTNQRKYDEALSQINFFGLLSRILFLVGIVLFLIYAGINLIK